MSTQEEKLRKTRYHLERAIAKCERTLYYYKTAESSTPFGYMDNENEAEAELKGAKKRLEEFDKLHPNI